MKTKQFYNDIAKLHRQILQISEIIFRLQLILQIWTIIRKVFKQCWDQFGKQQIDIQICIIQISASKQTMRIFVTVPDESGSTRKTRLTLVDCNTTNELLRKVSALCGIQQRWLIVKLKQEIANIRVIEGWSLQGYPLRNGSELVIDVLPGGIKNDSPMPSIAKLGKIDEQLELQIQDTSTTIIGDQKLSFFSGNSSDQYDWTKYFQQSLEKFLDAVRRQSMQEVSGMLKQEPECQDEKVLARIMSKKVSFLLNEVGDCGRCALHWAIQQKNLVLVEFLLIKSSDPNTVSIDEYTPLQLAIAMRASSIFQTLVSHPKIDLNKVTKKGSALHLCIEIKSLDYAQKLLDCGANPLVENLQGVSVIQFSQQKNIKSLVFKNNSQKSRELPYILRGTIWRVSSFASRLKQRLLVSNPFTNELILFDEKNSEDKIKQTQIKQIQQVKQKDRSWSMKKQYFYFQIFVQGHDNILLAVKNVQIGKQWINGLRKGVAFSVNTWAQPNDKAKQKMKVPQVEQYIEVLDDKNNTIQVHKNKLNQKKQRKKSNHLNLFQIKPMDQGQQQSSSSVLSPRAQKIPQKQPSSAPNIRSSSPIANIEQGPRQFQQVMLQSTNIIKQIPTTPPYYNNPSNQQTTESDYLRDSQLLGSVIFNQMLSNNYNINNNNNKGSISNSRESIRNSIFDDKNPRPSVCFKDFQILRQLGSGTFGRVFLTRYKKTQKLYALKVLNKKKLMAKKHLKYAVGQANILKRVDSPFIIKLHFSFQTPSNLYIAIDYCPNGDLTQIMSDEQNLSEKVCRFYIAQLILAVDYLHKNKIMYRDLKPENILIGQDGYIRLTDFNLSKQNTFSMSFCGSPAYLSPEMLEKKGVGFEADIYGIGCVLYEMLVGQPPYFDENIEVLYENIKNGKLKFPAGISKSAKSLISGLLDRNKSKRLGAKNTQQIRNHEFFSGFDWQKLEKVQMKIPPQLELRNKKNTLQVIQQHGFQDSDYENSSVMINRIKSFTFIRENSQQVETQSVEKIEAQGKTMSKTRKISEGFLDL